jgi:hypothetical protein
MHPPQKFEPQPISNGLSYGIKNYCTEVTFNGITCLPSFMKIYQSVLELLGRGRGDIQTKG